MAPTNATVGVYVSEVPSARGEKLYIEVAALEEVEVCAVPIAPVMVPPPIIDVITKVPVHDALPVGVPNVPVVGAEVNAVPRVTTAMAAVTTPEVTVIVPVAPDPPPPVTVNG
jgi:hypothetical protein